MEQIKVYKEVIPGNSSIHFNIVRTEEVYKRKKGQVDIPHRHNFYTIIFFRQAKGCHMIDFNSFELKNEQLFFVSPGQVHQVSEDQMSEGYAMTFSQEFLIENRIDPTFISDLSLFHDYGYSPPLLLKEKSAEKIAYYCEEMLILGAEVNIYKGKARAALLSLMLIHCHQYYRDIGSNLQREEAGNTVLKAFKELVEKNHKEKHQSSEYADLLNISPDHLNRTIKSLIGKNAKEFIQSRLLIEAKRLLWFSAESTKEIAYGLGFKEPAHFSNFFKKMTGDSPTKFRESRT